MLKQGETYCFWGNHFEYWLADIPGLIYIKDEKLKEYNYKTKKCETKTWHVFLWPTYSSLYRLRVPKENTTIEGKKITNWNRELVFKLLDQSEHNKTVQKFIQEAQHITADPSFSYSKKEKLQEILKNIA